MRRPLQHLARCSLYFSLCWCILPSVTLPIIGKTQVVLCWLDYALSKANESSENELSQTTLQASVCPVCLTKTIKSHFECTQVVCAATGEIKPILSYIYKNFQCYNISKTHQQHYYNENKEHKIGTIGLCLNSLGIISNAMTYHLFIYVVSYFSVVFRLRKLILTKSQP